MKILPLFILATGLAVSSATRAADNTTNPPAEADNTGQNKQDRDSNTKTSFDQSEDPKDVELTASIRRMLVKDDSLSGLAKNCKIITADERVLLRGPVETAAEKKKIVEHARMAGAKDVQDQLEVKVTE